MLINVGTQERVLNETTVSAGTTTHDGAIRSSALLASLYVADVSSGSLSVSVYTLTDDTKQVLLFSFPVLTNGTADLLLKKSGVSLQRFRIIVTYTGICTYEMYVRAIDSAGDSSTQILGATELRTSSAAVATTPTILIPAALTDRSAVTFKNFSDTATVFVSESSAKLPADGWPLSPGETWAVDVAAGTALYAISSSGTADVRIAELGN